MEAQSIISDYERPFCAEDFKGYFVWNSDLSKKLLPKYVHHACHECVVRESVRHWELKLRTPTKLALSNAPEESVPSIWTSLNYYSDNIFGPFVFQIPIQLLEGRTFLVFLRCSNERDRYFFLEYKMPPNSPLAQSMVAPDSFFVKDKRRLLLKNYDIYCVIATAPLPFGKLVLTPVSHLECSSGECSGSPGYKNEARFEELVKSFCPAKRS